jgi:hypothetical protein
MESIASFLGKPFGLIQFEALAHSKSIRAALQSRKLNKHAEIVESDLRTTGTGGGALCYLRSCCCAACSSM